MNKILKVLVCAVFLTTSAFAYTSKGITLEFEGFKAQKKLGVTGTFKQIEVHSTTNDNFIEFVKSLHVKIDGLSVNTKMPFRDKNIGTLFSTSKTPYIQAKVIDVVGDEKQGNLSIEVTMNEGSEKFDFPYTFKDNKLEAKGSVDILKITTMATPFAEYAKKCKGLHAGKSWSDVSISFVVDVE